MDKDFRQQVVIAETIQKRSMKDWNAKAKKYLPTYVADYLFAKQGKIEEMLKIDESVGFKFDPETVASSAETILLMLENVSRNHPERARRLYSNFGNHQTRIEYLFPFIDHLDIYHAIEREVVQDLKMRQAGLEEGSEEYEVCGNRIRNVQARAEAERREMELKNSKQPY